jgi:NAD(P) transhydrogenase subunit alpha
MIAGPRQVKRGGEVRSEPRPWRRGTPGNATDVADCQQQLLLVWRAAGVQTARPTGAAIMDLDVMSYFYVFLLAAFLGLEVIRRVSPLLHTPLMSLTNAISAITIVGSIIIAGKQQTTLSTVLGAMAVGASSINIVGGYLITYRMLRMFKKSQPKKP